LRETARVTGRFVLAIYQHEEFTMRILQALTLRLLLAISCLLTISTAILVGVRFPFFAFVILAIVFWRAWTRRSSGWVHGTAKLATWRDLYFGGFLGSKGSLIGTTAYVESPSRAFAVSQIFKAPLRYSAFAVRLFLGSFWGGPWSRNTIRIYDSCHWATFARSGGGKGVSVVIPTLLSDRRSTVVTDPKRENFQTTVWHRTHVLKHRVISLAPFAEKSDCYNPLDMIDHTSVDFIDQTKDLAAALIIRTGKEVDRHWSDWAERVIQAMIGLVCVISQRPEDRNLIGVRNILASREKYESALNLMKISGTVAGGVLVHLGESLSWLQDKELAGVLSTCQRMLAFLDSPQIAAHICTSTFNPKDLLHGRMTIFMSLPSDRLISHSAIQRMWITCFLHALAHNKDERKQTLFLLDEVGNMGRLEILEHAVTLYRGMGVRLHFIFQSLGQVKALYGDNAQTFMDNIGTQLYFNILGLETAKQVSERLGDHTVITTSDQSGSSDSRPTGNSSMNSQGGSYTSTRNRTTSELARKLMKPEEILTMDPQMCICFHNHHAPIVARLVRYYNSPLFRTWRRARYRTGEPRQLGIAAGLFVTLTLTLSVAFCLLPLAIASMPSPRMAAPSNLQRQLSDHRQWIGTPVRQVGRGLPQGYRSVQGPLE
jgi:type IV secretion system protein VirD4